MLSFQKHTISSEIFMNWLHRWAVSNPTAALCYSLIFSACLTILCCYAILRPNSRTKQVSAVLPSAPSVAKTVSVVTIPHESNGLPTVQTASSDVRQPNLSQPKTIDELLIGKWRFYYFELGGYKQKADSEVSEFQNGFVRIGGVDGEKAEIPWRTDISQKPAYLDFGLRGEQVFTPRIIAIFSLSGDDLIICLAGEKGRPGDFSTSEDDFRTLLKFKRK